MKRYLFIGSVQYSAFCLKTLLEMGVNIVSVMCPHKRVSKFNSDYFDLGIIARDFHKKIRYFGEIGDQAAYIREMRPDVIFVLGLSQIVPKEILSIPTIGCIGSHPALLPHNRGRHPIIWAIANGLKKSGLTLFWMDEGIDSGDIWMQKAFRIDETDDAASIYGRIKRLTHGMLRKGMAELEKGIVRRMRQDHSQSNYWRKRSPEDGRIDWRMSSRRIHDLVRSLVRPYPGAYCVYQNKKIKIWKTRIQEGCVYTRASEPGKIMRSDKAGLIVKTGDGLILLKVHEFGSLPNEGDYLL